MTPTHEYDMVSLAEKPRKIEINNPRGPYNPAGKFLAGKVILPGESNVEIELDILTLADEESLCFVFPGEGKNLLQFDSFEFL